MKFRFQNCAFYSIQSFVIFLTFCCCIDAGSWLRHSLYGHRQWTCHVCVYAVHVHECMCAVLINVLEVMFHEVAKCHNGRHTTHFSVYLSSCVFIATHSIVVECDERTDLYVFSFKKSAKNTNNRIQFVCILLFDNGTVYFIFILLLIRIIAIQICCEMAPPKKYLKSNKGGNSSSASSKYGKFHSFPPCHLQCERKIETIDNNCHFFSTYAFVR